MTSKDISELKQYAQKIISDKNYKPDNYTDMIKNILMRQKPSAKQCNALQVFVEKYLNQKLKAV